MRWFYAMQNKIQALLPVGTCKAQVIFFKELPAANGLDAARRGDVGALDLIPRHFITCPKMYDRCQRCAGFQAYRQVFTACQDRSKDLAVTLAAQKVEPHVRDGKFKGTEVDCVDQQGPTTAHQAGPIRNTDPQAHTIL